MFEIEYKGANCMVVSTKKAKIVIDPKLSIVGLNDVSTKGSVELLTDERYGVFDQDSTLTIEGPGEYGVAEFDILGVPARRHIDHDSEGMMSTIYRLVIGDVRIGVVGNIDKKLSEDQLEGLGVIDILIIPIGGGGYTLDAVDAAKLVKLIDPKVVIPTHYADAHIKYEVPQDSLDQFVTELGAPVETVAKYKFKQLVVAPAALSIVEITRN